MNPELSFTESPPGFRLNAVELYNWGTFTQQVWRFPVGGANALVTGEIGSGKSTFVDALTTLLVPPQRITYNKAAGAERRERTLRGYVLGEYKRSRDDESPGARPIHLRDEGTYSVITASFEDSRARRLLSLAQLFWLKGGEVQRLFVASGRQMTVLSDFSAFDGDGVAFKKRLRLQGATEVFDTFSEYATAFRSTMGITEKALDLFYQTVSMKTIGDLDDFIRNHMLEPTQARERVASLLANYENLRISHDAVERARRQREALLPIAAEGKELKALESAIEELRGMLDVLPFYVLSLMVPLLGGKKAEHEVELGRIRKEQRDTDARLEAERDHEASVRAAIEQSEVGRRIAGIEQRSRQLAAERDHRRERDAVYRALVEGLSYTMPVDARSFDENLQRSKADARTLQTERAKLEDERDELRSTLKAQAAEAEELRREIASLRP
ncbi:MAG: ATP-dependent exonuclease SbcCD, C subunit-like protein, partial [Acidobacteria bacterium]|nr:ATP-dependent exonuclease SbcCD, C subunit-like protein [Acidobacteriota bacterium]